MNSSIKRLIERLDKENVVEDNTTANIPPVDTPYAFSKNKKVQVPDDEAYSEPVHPTERFFKKIESVIREVNYNDYKNDGSQTERQKINSNIIEINKKLREVEQMISHAHKLKNESGHDNGVFWKRTAGSFIKIKERLNRLSTKIIEFSGE